jgi:hypothetical protein
LYNDRVKTPHSGCLLNDSRRDDRSCSQHRTSADNFMIDGFDDALYVSRRCRCCGVQRQQSYAIVVTRWPCLLSDPSVVDNGDNCEQPTV